MKKQSPEQIARFNKDALIAKLQYQLEEEQKFNEWLKYFSGYIYREHKDTYGKASTTAYELLKINLEGEEANERRKEILAKESKQITSREKNSKSSMDE
jgi:hypothetical protein